MINRFDQFFSFSEYEDKTKLESGLISKELSKLNAEKKYEEAILKAKEYIDKQPKLAVAYFEKGVAEMEKGWYLPSFVSYSVSAQLKGAVGLSNAYRGQCLTKLGFIEQSFSSWDLSLKANPSLAIAFFYKGVNYESMRRYDEALACFQRAQLLQPTLPLVDRHIAELKKRFDDMENKRKIVGGSQIEGTNQKSNS